MAFPVLVQVVAKAIGSQIGRMLLSLQWPWQVFQLLQHWSPVRLVAKVFVESPMMGLARKKEWAAQGSPRCL